MWGRMFGALGFRTLERMDVGWSALQGSLVKIRTQRFGRISLLFHVMSSAGNSTSSALGF